MVHLRASVQLTITGEKTLFSKNQCIDSILSVKYETITCIRYNSGLLAKVQALVIVQVETDLKEWGARFE